MKNVVPKQSRYSLNPCSNGMKIECICAKYTYSNDCLNPCSNGMKIELP